MDTSAKLILAYIGVAVYFIFVISAFSTALRPDIFIAGNNLNEIVQDYFERNIGLADATEQVLNSKEKKETQTINYPNLHVSIGHESLGFSTPGRNNYGGGILKNAGKKYPADADSGRFSWNTHMTGKLQNSEALAYLRFYSLYTILLPSLVLGLLWLVNILYRKKKKLNAVAFLIFSISLSIIYFWHFLSMNPCWRNYYNSADQTEKILVENVDRLHELLSSSRPTGIYPLQFLQKAEPATPIPEVRNLRYFPLKKQEKSIHNGEVFLSKTPLMYYDYIRINVDLYNYLFFAPSLTQKELNSINPQMKFRYLQDGIWLGRYANLISLSMWILIAYMIATPLWAIVLFFSCYFLLFSRKYNADGQILARS